MGQKQPRESTMYEIEINPNADKKALVEQLQYRHNNKSKTFEIREKGELVELIKSTKIEENTFLLNHVTSEKAEIVEDETERLSEIARGLVEGEFVEVEA